MAEMAFYNAKMPLFKFMMNTALIMALLMGFNGRAKKIWQANFELA